MRDKIKDTLIILLALSANAQRPAPLDRAVPSTPRLLARTECSTSPRIRIAGKAKDMPAAARILGRRFTSLTPIRIRSQAEAELRQFLHVLRQAESFLRR